MAGDGLTDDQENLVEQFYEITSAASVPRAVVTQFLQTNDWNLELAIVAYYQSQPGSQRDFVSNYSASVQRMSSNSRSGLSRFLNAFGGRSADAPLLPGTFPAENETNPSKWHLWINRAVFYAVLAVQFVVILPLVVVLRCALLLAKLFTERAVPLANKVLGLRSSSTYYARRNVTNAVERSRRFIYEFDESINNKPLIDVTAPAGEAVGIRTSDSALMEISRPNFLECSYTNALFLVKKEFRWLMIYLQSDEHEDNMQFVDQVMLNEQLLAFLRTNGILCWGGNVKESESYQIANNFNVAGFPFLGLITLTGEADAAAPQISMVSKVQGLTANLLRPDGSINTSKIVHKFHKTFDRINPALVALRTESQERERSRSLREQQDAAYQRSLEADRRRDAQRAAEARRAAEQAQLAERKSQWLRSSFAALLERESAHDGADRKEFSRIAIRLPNGERIQHNFHRSLVLSDIYLYAECAMNGIVADGAVSGSGTVLPQDYTHKYAFKLSSVMPRAELEYDDTRQIGDTQLVFPGGNLVVEEL